MATKKSKARKKAGKNGRKKKADKKKAKKASKKKPAKKASKKPAKKASKKPATRTAKQPAKRTDTWPSDQEWRQSGLCAQAQADGVPCTEVGRHCEICERADMAEAHTR